MSKSSLSCNQCCHEGESNVPGQCRFHVAAATGRFHSDRVDRLGRLGRLGRFDLFGRQPNASYRWLLPARGIETLHRPTENFDQ